MPGSGQGVERADGAAAGVALGPSSIRSRGVPGTSAHGIGRTHALKSESRAMPQMFDWIFFAIMLPFPAFLVWDWYKHR